MIKCASFGPILVGLILVDLIIENIYHQKVQSVIDQVFLHSLALKTGTFHLRPERLLIY